MGVKGEDALNWLKSFKDFKLDHIDFDTETEGLEEYDIADIAKSQGVDIFNADFKEADHPRDKDGKFAGGSQYSESTSKPRKQRKPLKLPKKEYAKVMSELRTHTTDEQKERGRFVRYIGGHCYSCDYNEDEEDYNVNHKTEIE